jgi:hypothetical protein
MEHYVLKFNNFPTCIIDTFVCIICKNAHKWLRLRSYRIIILGKKIGVK